MGCRRVKIPNTAFVNILPIQQDKISKWVNKYGNGFEKVFIQIVINGAASGKRNLPFARSAAKKYTNADFG
jgi:hypothetical protein